MSGQDADGGNHERDLSTPVRQVFGDVAKGTECRVCGRNVTDGRAKYCTDYCRNLAKAVMSMLNWSGVRRRVKERDDYQCQECGFDMERERKAKAHIRDIIDGQLPERPQPPVLSEQREDFDWDRHFEEMDEWNEERDRLREKYGNPDEFDNWLEVDHIQPISEGGHPFDPGNLQTLCGECHKDKTAREASERAERRTPTKGDMSESLFNYVADGGNNAK